ncbi:hypothetical protein G7B40_025290 [Aetokthonos hydrillicola Thurmond2011]|jgi:hypothetical protein|uniref:Uncharacterized protein n=1 Tax=Aetokthonos hydrillicola Thurmond2011 TaxID=2712845 RepID=A0AAP5IDS6_9CYAN|nr:hypothetical protein [Aetokthonos hydrillicola]MBO3458427.1 hypothetical protein [Aetokthonos hydrillicola CCALA 1050]MBW4586246.1 hypothetical protein [Aetokthonos hydrillicola CCALA 1050]MDR9897853.1 hypothetical protein [Aetokthonos hydrillicola Thurmond2011]
MQSIKLRSRVGKDGVLHLDLPVEMTDTEIEVTVIIQRVTPQQRGWMPGFFEEVIGGWVGEPLQRPEQGEYETREQLF